MTRSKAPGAQDEDGIVEDIGELLGTTIGGLAGPVGAGLGAKLGACIGEKIDDMVDQRQAPVVEAEAADQTALRVGMGMTLAGASLAGAFAISKATDDNKPTNPPKRRPDKTDAFAALLVAAYFVARV